MDMMSSFSMNESIVKKLENIQEILFSWIGSAITRDGTACPEG